MDHRKDEPATPHFRAERFFNSNGLWYFATRENIDVGPYSSRNAAETGADELARLLELVSRDTDAARRVIAEYQSSVWLASNS